jgi:NADH-quinone oxidoreductase subunit E
MSPLLPSRRRPWLDDPGHIHDSPEPPPMPDEQERIAPEETLATTPVRLDSAGRQMVHEPRGPDKEPAEVPDINEVDVPEELAAEIRKAMSRYPEKRSASIPALWAVQKRYGYCSPEGIRQAAAVMGLTPGYLQSVASFYDLFHLEPQGEHEILVCTNISCWLRGGDDVLGAFIEAAGVGGPGETSADGAVYVRGFECLGACDIAPMASIDQRYYGPLEADDAAKALDALRGGSDVLPEKRLEDRKAAGGDEPGSGQTLPPRPSSKEIGDA